jgi:lipid-A-disaccharide synthase
VNAPQSSNPGVLFTAFEPSGDDHASAVIAEIRRRHPSLGLYAWGGPKMEAAGATIIERTGEDAVMGMPGLEKIREHRRINARVDAWLGENRVAVHVPVDSPAANFPICAIAKARGIKVVHMVAPQVWAWGTWRIGKLRRLTDLVLCLLPFEEGWFTTRGVPARFIGHPLFDEPVDEAALARDAERFPDGSPKIALMPGSRPAELTKNFPVLLDAFRRVRAAHPGARGLVAAMNTQVESRLAQIAQSASGGLPEGLDMVAGKTDAVTRWCDLALVVSGTVTLQVCRQRKPMVAVYKSNPVLYYLLAKWLLATRYFALPNLIAGREVVPELIPHFGGAAPIARAADGLIRSPEAMDRQRAELGRIAERFQGHNAARTAADAIAEMVSCDLGRATPSENH